MTTPLPTVPQSTRPLTFNTESDVFLPALVTFQQELDAVEANLAAVAAGTARSISYTFSTTTTDSDPGAGTLRLDNATQNAATTIRVDLLDNAALDWTTVLDTFATATDTIKGTIRLVKQGDATKFLQFNLTALASPAGYRNLAVTLTSSSASNPFTNGDQLSLQYLRGGSAGTSGTVRRHTTSVVSSATPTPDGKIDDIYCITALAVPATFGAPTNTPNNGQTLWIRVKDNGTARALAYNVIYRASTDLALPSTTVISKTLHMGFVYNSADTKWDLVAVLGNF